METESQEKTLARVRGSSGRSLFEDYKTWEMSKSLLLDFFKDSVEISLSFGTGQKSASFDTAWRDVIRFEARFFFFFSEWPETCAARVRWRRGPELLRRERNAHLGVYVGCIFRSSSAAARSRTEPPWSRFPRMEFSFEWSRTGPITEDTIWSVCSARAYVDTRASSFWNLSKVL